MGCDLCGRDAPLTRVRIEGTVMMVCPSCKTHGEVIAEPVRRVVRQPRPSAPRAEPLEFVRDSCGQLIKRARERRGLKQEELARRLRLKTSQLHAFESGSHKPDLKTARLLERELGITLVQAYVEDETTTPPPASGAPLTLGDLIARRR